MSKYIRQKPIEQRGEVVKSTVIVGNFNITLSEMDRYSKQKISKNIVEFNSTIISWILLISLHHIIQKSAEYTLFSGSHGTFTKSRPHFGP